MDHITQAIESIGGNPEQIKKMLKDTGLDKAIDKIGKVQAAQDKGEPIIFLTDDIAFKRSDFKRASNVTNGELVKTKIFFNDGSFEIVGGMSVKEVINKIG